MVEAKVGEKKVEATKVCETGRAKGARAHLGRAPRPPRCLSPERPADEGGTDEEPPGTPPALPGVPQFLSDRLSTRTR
jgi:hypothetical protein